MKNMRRKIRDLIWLIISKFHKNVMVFYGTSLTEGSGWVKLIAKQLPGWHIVNLAKGGMDSSWGLANVKLVLRFKPKVILMEWAINDSLGSDLSNSFLNVEKMISAFHNSRWIRIIFLAMNPPFNMFLSGRNPAKARPDYRKFAKLHQTIAEAHKFQHIDITSDWDRLTKDEFLHYCPDGIHPNILASRDIIVPRIMKELIL